MDKSLAVVKVKVISISKKSLPLVEAQLLRRATKPPLPWQQAPLASFTNQQEARGEKQEITRVKQESAASMIEVAPPETDNRPRPGNKTLLMQSR